MTFLVVDKIQVESTGEVGQLKVASSSQFWKPLNFDLGKGMEQRVHDQGSFYVKTRGD